MPTAGQWLINVFSRQDVTPDNELKELSDSCRKVYYGKLLVKRRWICFLLVIVLSVSAVFLSQGLKFNGSLKVWFVEDDPAMQRLDDFKREFGNDHFVYLLAEPAEGGDVFTPDTVNLL
ncbi:hypothetical protein ADUPG1_001384, partial [Aduncisulcus paluster]